MENFKYKTLFSQQIIGCSKLSKYDFLEKSKIANYFSSSSLDSLEAIIPEEIDLDKNVDLIGTAFNAAVVNKFNKNGDGINSDTAIAIKDYFVHKPTNIEHKKQKVVGHIVSSAFSSIGDNMILSNEDVKDSKDAFYISLGAVVYKMVNQEFAKMLDKIEDDEEYLPQISASWELGFNDYVIALGGDGIDNSEIISDKNQIKEFSKYLKANDGSGLMDDGTEVNRLIVGDVFPLGIGYTINPAANVRGVHVKSWNNKNSEEEKSQSSKFFNKNYSHNEKKNVITLQEKKSHINTMDPKEIIQKLEEVASGQKFSEEAVASISKIVRDAITQKSEEYVKEQNALAEEKKEMEEREAKMLIEAKEVRDQLEIAKREIEDLKTAAAEAHSKEVYNSRMDVIDSAYELTNEDRQVLAGELQKLDVADEAFAEYQQKISIMWQHKDKKVIEAREKEIQKKIDEEVSRRLSELSDSKATSVASEACDSKEEAVLEQALENAEAAAAEVTSNNGETVEKELSLKEKFHSLFNRDNIKITY